MGDVHLCVDAHLGRQVAFKQLHQSVLKKGRNRFLREARLQAQLEHPAIVPLYDLGETNGAPWFTMKRVQGRTLRCIIDDLAGGNQQRRTEYSQRKLLSAFSTACLAIDYAHVHGVVHRDLKPANIMLGDFGEVYVLDWGVAKVVAASDSEPLSFEPLARGETNTGIVLGTPGYIPPEQLDCTVGTISAQTDIYALGSILFQILTLKRLHEGDNAMSVIRSTLRATDVSLADTFGQDQPPELVAVCQRALAVNLKDRARTAREIHQAIERYLDGERDLIQRREQATQHASIANAALARAMSGCQELSNREIAMREAGKALALDPQHAQAMGVCMRLLTELPVNLPEEVKAGLEQHRMDMLDEVKHVVAGVYAIPLLFVPLIAFVGVRNWTALVVLGLLSLVTVACGVLKGRLWGCRDELAGPFFMLTMVLVGALSVVAGPYVLVPGIAAVSIMGQLMVNRYRRLVWTSVCGCATFMVPLLLQWAGVIDPFVVFTQEAMVLPAKLFTSSAAMSHFVMVAGNVALVVGSALFAIKFRNRLVEYERRALLSRWQLRQLVPCNERAKEETKELC